MKLISQRNHSLTVVLYQDVHYMENQVQFKFNFFIIMVLMTLCACESNKSEQNKTLNTFSNGIFEIVDTDSGKVQIQEKNPVDRRMEELKISGLSISIIDNYKINETITFGKRDSVNKVRNNTLFQAASVSKYVTAILVLQFIDRGILDLDTDINHYLKSWKMPINDFTKDNPITLRHLLTHQSGLPSTNFDYEKEKGMPTLSQVLNAESPSINKPAIPEFSPGSSWSYSNLGYALIQQILEDVANKSFQNIAQELLFEPLGMSSSTFIYPLSKSLRDREALPFNKNGQQKLPDLNSPAKAQGGLLTTTEDLAMLTLELLRSSKGNSIIFSEDLVHNLLTKEVELPFKFYGQSAYMGLGVILIGKKEDLAFLHNGYNSPGSVCIVIGFPEIGKGAVIASNSANGEHLYLEIIATLAKKHEWPSGQFFKE